MVASKPCAERCGGGSVSARCRIIGVDIRSLHIFRLRHLNFYYCRSIEREFAWHRALRVFLLNDFLWTLHRLG